MCIRDRDHPIRISIGCAQYKPEDDNLGELVRRADEAMYEMCIRDSLAWRRLTLDLRWGK